MTALCHGPSSCYFNSVGVSRERHLIDYCFVDSIVIRLRSPYEDRDLGVTEFIGQELPYTVFRDSVESRCNKWHCEVCDAVSQAHEVQLAQTPFEAMAVCWGYGAVWLSDQVVQLPSVMLCLHDIPNFEVERLKVGPTSESGSELLRETCSQFSISANAMCYGM